MILDIEGFVLRGNRVIVREVGWCDMNGFSDSFHFKPEVQYNSLSPRDKRTASYVFHNIHALPFEARSQENAAEGYLVEFVVKLRCTRNSLPSIKMLSPTREEQLKNSYCPDWIFHTLIWKLMIVPKPTVCFGTDSNLFLIVGITLILIPIALEWKRICFTNRWLVILDR